MTRPPFALPDARGLRPAPSGRTTSGRIEVRERSGVWEVRLDDAFHGDYFAREDAEAAADALGGSL